MLNIIINKLFPVILMFVLGYSLKEKKVFKSSDAQLFFRITSYNVCYTKLLRKNQEVQKMEYSLGDIKFNLVRRERKTVGIKIREGLVA